MTFFHMDSNSFNPVPPPLPSVTPPIPEATLSNHQVPPPVPDTTEPASGESTSESSSSILADSGWPIYEPVHSLEKVQEECRRMPLFHKTGKEWVPTDFITEFHLQDWQFVSVSAVVFVDQHTLSWYRRLDKKKICDESRKLDLTYVSPFDGQDRLPEPLKQLFKKPIPGGAVRPPLPVHSFIKEGPYKTMIAEAKANWEHRQMSVASGPELFPKEIESFFDQYLEKDMGFRWRERENLQVQPPSFSSGFLVKLPFYFAEYTIGNQKGYLFWNPITGETEATYLSYEYTQHDFNTPSIKIGWPFWLSILVVLFLPVRFLYKILILIAVIGIWAAVDGYKSSSSDNSKESS